MIPLRAHPVLLNARRALTLVELIVTIVIGLLVAGATATAVSQLSKSRAASLARQQAFSRAETGAGLIAQDLQCAARNGDGTHEKIAIEDGGAGKPDEILMLITTLRPLRGESWNPEGQDFESQFRVGPSGKHGALWHRLDPALDDAIDAGGVASAVVPGVTNVSIEAYDGSDWYDAWDSDSDGMPHAVRVTVTATSEDGTRTATARRIVAIDRVPLEPIVAVGTTPTSSPTPQPSTGTPSTTTPGATTPGGTTGGRPARGGRGGRGGAGQTGGQRPGQGQPGAGQGGRPGGQRPGAGQGGDQGGGRTRPGGTGSRPAPGGGGTRGGGGGRGGAP